MFLPNRNGDGAASPAGSLKRSSLGRGTSGSTGSYFTRRTTAAQFTNGSDSSLATKCVSSAISWTRPTKESHLQPESERTLDLSRIAVPADELRLYHCGSCFPRSRRRQAAAVRSRLSLLRQLRRRQ